MPASEQLERLLYILPVAAREEGVHIDELARALDVPRETVLRDLQEATARAYNHPAGFVEEFSIFIEGDVVSVHAPAEFKRPARLSPREALALGLGLRTLASEAEAERRAAILAFARRIEQELATPPIDVQPRLHEVAAPMPLEVRAPMPEMAVRAVDVELGEDEFRGGLSDAIVQRRICRITYLSPTAREPVEREIKPVRLVYASGHWYIGALVGDSDEARMYRLDRVLRLRVSDQVFEPVAATIDTSFTPRAGAARDVRVRYSPRIARWIAEERDDVVLEEDGSLVLTHQVSDQDWLVRHVLQYGGEALVETEGYRELVRRAAKALTAG